MKVQLYGTFGAPSSIFFNLHVAPSITTQGRSTISASITFFEAFLSNNTQFGSLDEMIMFIDNVRCEKTQRKFEDGSILDRNIDVNECFLKLMSTSGYMWIPTNKEADVVWDILTRISQEDLNRIYYKNNLFEFCNNSKVQNLIYTMVTKLKTPFMDPNKAPKEIEDELYLFTEFLKEYVYYEYITIDKLDRVEVMPRDSVLIVDTDSCIVNLYPWYQFVLPMIEHVDMPIKHQSYDIVELIETDEFGDRDPITIAKYVEPDRDFDFYNEEVVELQRAITPGRLIPQDGVTNSIINIMGYVIGQLVLDYMAYFCRMNNSELPDKSCLMIMKNEFLFKSILLSYVKKHYMSNVLTQEGHSVPKKAALAITGMDLAKSATPEATSKELKSILFEEILDNEKGVDQLAVLRRLRILESDIYKSLLSGEATYHKPVKSKPYDTYKLPMRVPALRAIIAFNGLRPEGTDEIDINENNSINLVKVNIDKRSVENIEDEGLKERAKALLQTEAFKAGIKGVGVKFGEPIPKWLFPLIDFNKVIQDNIGLFPLNEIGINTMGNTNIPHSNILTL